MLSGRPGSRLCHVLAAAQVAVALVLLTGAALMTNSFLRLLSHDLGFEPEEVLTFSVKLPLGGGRYSTVERITSEHRVATVLPATGRFWEKCLEGIRAIPGVLSADLTNEVPTRGSPRRRSFHVVGRELVPEGEEPLAIYREIGEQYFETMRIPVLRGRGFTKADRSGTPWTAIINESLARQAFQDKDPIGRVIQVRVNPRPMFLGPVPRLPNEDRPREIIGVVGDTRDNVHEEPEPTLYITFRQAPGHYVVWNGTFYFTLRKRFVVRTSADPAALIPAMKQAIAEVDPQQTLYDPVTLERIVARSFESDRLWSQLLGLFAALAISLTAVGLYGVVSWTIAQRTRELGLRMALGARGEDVRRMVVRQGLALGLVGIAVGAAAAAGLARFLGNRLYGIEPTDPATFLAASLTLAAVSALASYLPARRATKIDPITALRSD